MRIAFLLLAVASSMVAASRAVDELSGNGLLDGRGNGKRTCNPGGPHGGGGSGYDCSWLEDRGTPRGAAFRCVHRKRYGAESGRQPRHIDFFIADHAEAKRFGRKPVLVRVIERGSVEKK